MLADVLFEAQSGHSSGIAGKDVVTLEKLPSKVTATYTFGKFSSTPTPSGS
jgi:hypothetical protein